MELRHEFGVFDFVVSTSILATITSIASTENAVALYIVPILAVLSHLIARVAALTVLGAVSARVRGD